MRLFLSALCLFSPLFSEEITIYLESGSGHYVTVNPEEKLGDLIQRLDREADAHKSLTVYRDYLSAVTPEEKAQIGFIVNTLGMNSLAKIAKQKSSLKRAGDRVNHVHPLRFLQVIFLDGKMKASIHALYGRSWVWDEFYDGLIQSLNEEQEKGNLPAEFVQDFTQSLQVSFDATYALIQQSNWSGFIKYLLKSIPRNEDADRYDM